MPAILPNDCDVSKQTINCLCYLQMTPFRPMCVVPSAEHRLLYVFEPLYLKPLEKQKTFIVIAHFIEISIDISAISKDFMSISVKYVSKTTTPHTAHKSTTTFFQHKCTKTPNLSISVQVMHKNHTHPHIVTKRKHAIPH